MPVQRATGALFYPPAGRNNAGLGKPVSLAEKPYFYDDRPLFRPSFNRMAETIYHQLSSLKSRLSFQPLLRLWKEAAEGDDTAAVNLCQDLYRRFSAIPALLQPTSDYAVLEPYQALINEAMTTLFPAGFSMQNELFAVAMPFSSRNIYASSFFRRTYFDEQNNYKMALDPQVEKNVAVARINLAYKLILRKWYDIELIGGHAFICSYPEREHNIHNYFELEWDPRFIDISTSMDLPPLSEEILLHCLHVQDLANYPELAALLPLDQFVFEGLVITRIREVSERETLNIIRGILQKERSLENPQTLLELQQQMRYLLRMDEAEIGLTAFYEAPPEVELPAVNFASILLRNNSDTHAAIRFCRHLHTALQQSPDWFWQKGYRYEHSNHEAVVSMAAVEEKLERDGWETALLTALYQDGKIIGCLEIVTRKGEPVTKKTLIRLEHARGLLQTALQHYRQQVHNTLSALVKEHFTAVQSSVEWKFNNAAIRYLLQQHQGEAAKMMAVVFEEVYPLYGVIDIKNSSGERNKAVQQDLLQQLQWTSRLLDGVRQQFYYPLLQEVLLRVNSEIERIGNFLFAADEQSVQHFLRTEVAELLRYIASEAPDFQGEIAAYLQQTDNAHQLLNGHLQKFEESITQINSTIIHFLEQEEDRMQKLYPHYFERFATDGVDFNLYIGQSIVPGKTFHPVHLKNLRLWQLQFLALAAQKVHRLGTQLPLPLQTTQLVLVYKDPIAIRFRNAERKFDVDSVHHARYEVVKKRIDKALVKDTGERLTQPNTIAVVYSSDEEAREYQQYIDYLKTQDLLTGETEMLEVEELQSVSGLKAMRLHINMTGQPPGELRRQPTAAIRN